MDAKKYETIQSQIKEAQKALQQWNDRRTEAMIELDSLFTEIEDLKKQSALEKTNHQLMVDQLNAELEKSDREFHRQFEAYTNDFQILKLENETLQKQLVEVRQQVEIQKKSFEKSEKDYQARISKITQETEVKVADQQYQLKSQISNLSSELQSIRNEKNSVAQKASQYEKELQVIRNQMMSFLNVTQEVSTSRTAVTAPIVVSAASLETKSNRDSNESNAPRELAGKLREPDLIVDHVSTAPVTVQDYLKRFGY